MSGRYRDSNKGSSRSTRDDYRQGDGRQSTGASAERGPRFRSRSRSPRRRQSPSRRNKTPEKSPNSHSRSQKYEDKQSKYKNEWESDEEVPAPPPPPRISKISIGFSKPGAPIKMNLGAQSTKVKTVSKPSVASIFNEDDDEEEPEEMPAEAKMRMRNIGRDTPTSAGPNSFGKTKQGFCDAKKVFEKNLKQALETADNKPSGKFPQTIYKITGP